jgi:protein-S-isoprenylcysteine O-methyltransferase Ste14
MKVARSCRFLRKTIAVDFCEVYFELRRRTRTNIEVRSAMPTAVYGVLIVIVTVMVAVGGVVLVQRFFPSALRQQHNEVAGFIYAVVGIVYAVLLALVVVAAWEEHEAAKGTVESEANELAELYWLAHKLPEDEQRRIQGLSRSYARVVIDEEWPLMAQGSPTNARAWELLDEMRLVVQDLEVSTRADQVLYEQGLERVHDLADARRTRLVEADEGIPVVLWVVLVVGGLVTVGFTYLFGLENTRVHRLMVGALAGVIALVLFTIGALEYPFSGGARVDPGAFELVLERFETSKLSDLR